MTSVVDYNDWLKGDMDHNDYNSFIAVLEWLICCTIGHYL